MSEESEYSWKRYITDYWLLLRGTRTRFVFFTVLRAITNFAPFAIAYLLGLIIDFITSYTGGSLTSFYWYVGVIAVLGSVQVWLRFYSKVRMQTIAAQVRRLARTNAMNTLIELDLRWHEGQETGGKIQKINHGGEMVFQGLKDFSNHWITIIMSLFSSLVLFLFIDAKYSFFCLFFIFIYVVVEKHFSTRLARRQGKLDAVKERVSGKFYESASNILAIKSLGLKESVGKHTSSYEEEYYQAWLANRTTGQRRSQTIKIFFSFAYAAFIFIVGFDALRGFISVGSVFVFITYFSKVRGSLDDLTNKMSDFIAVRSGVGRFMRLLGTQSFEDESKLESFPSDWKKIEFRDVHFKYKDEPVLRGVSFTIHKGEKLGFVGASGSGKSTIAKLLLKLYKPDKGVILVDGVDVQKMNQYSITSSVSVVLQEPELFNLSVLENVRITNLDADDLLVARALEVSQLLLVIKKLPQGVETLIGEKGYRLSGGERQRVGIARALCRDASLLIFDEATSALDTKTESEVLAGLATHVKGKTLVVIAHRLSSVKDADTIIVLEQGRVVESGRYAELLKRKKTFFELSQAQRK